MIKSALNWLGQKVSGKVIAASVLSAFLASSFIAWAQQTNYLGTVFVADSTVPSRQLTVSANGEVLTRLSASGAVISAGNPSDNLANGIQVHQGNALLSVFDGTTWDRARGTAEAGLWVQGGVATGATDSGNPVKIGGVFTTTAPTVTTGQRSDIALGSTGSVRMQLCNVNDGGSTNCVNLGSDNTDGSSSTSSAQRPIMASRGWKFNGSTWDRDFACTNQASATVTAAATTQIVALGASQVIRVCSFSVGMSASGTAKFVQGTGANCGTGTADITPATNITSGNVWTMGNGEASVLRTGSGNALCVTAATGNAQVFVTYAQY